MASVLAGIALAALLAQAPAAADPTAAAEIKANAGDLAGAAADYRRLLESAGSPRALVLYRLANLERQLGDDQAAIAHALEAAALFDGAADPGRSSEALHLAAMTEFRRANYTKAAQHLDRAVGESERAKDWARLARQLSDLATVHFFVGRYDDAQRANGRALGVTDLHRREPWATRMRTVIVANQAALHQRLGRYAEALSLYRETPSSGGALSPGEHAQTLVNEGALYRRLGDPYKALAVYAEAHAEFARAKDVPGEVTVLTNRGIALALDLDRGDDAVAAFSTVAEMATTAGLRREALLAHLYRAETRLRRGEAEPARADFATALTSATAMDAREEQWKALYGLARVELAAGHVSLAREAFERAIAVIDGLRERLAVPSTRVEFFQDKREVYDARIALSVDTDPPGNVFALVERSRARGWRERLKLDEVTLAGVQARLAPGTVMLAYWWSAPQAAVVRITRDQAAVTRLTVDARLLTAMVDAMRHPEGPDWTEAAEALGRALLPEGITDGAAHVVVVPDGALGAVPFEALTVKGAPLVARAAVSYLPTAALLSAPMPAAGWRAPWTKQLAAFGDPISGDDTWSTPGAAPRLVASAQEVRNIAQELGGTSHLFLGRDNRKSALIATLQQPPTVLHVATHGVADLVSGERSRLLFSPIADGGPSESLFLREVYDLPLGTVDLAVLSACDTERGPDVRGEGVQGFSRGLLAAGAARAVTTLWRVPDAAAAEFMRVFYDHLQRGERADDALAETKRALIASDTLAHPHFWAAFVLTGRTDAIPRALRWRDVWGRSLIVLGSLGLAWMLRRRRNP